MAVALICSASGLERELSSTLLFRHGVERHAASGTAAAIQIARNVVPDLVLVDAELRDAQDLVKTMRSHPQTRGVPIAVLSRTSTHDLSFLDAGASEILHLPGGHDLDERLIRLFRIPGRKEARFSFRVDVTAQARGATPVRATAVNLSASGLLLESDSALGVGDHVRFAFRVPGSASPVEGAGWVVREAAPGRFGIQFLYLEGDGLVRVRHAIDASADPI